jgi:hypothetical protein
MLEILIKFYLIVSLSLSLQCVKIEQQPVPATDCPYRCDLCSMSFNNDLELKRHKHTHLPQRPHVCKRCHKVFIPNGMHNLQVV